MCHKYLPPPSSRGTVVADAPVIKLRGDPSSIDASAVRLSPRRSPPHPSHLSISRHGSCHLARHQSTTIRHPRTTTDAQRQHLAPVQTHKVVISHQCRYTKTSHARVLRIYRRISRFLQAYQLRILILPSTVAYLLAYFSSR